MKDNLEEAIREQVAVFLPAVLQKALDSYHEFMSREILLDTKEFTAHHAAGKVAIAHLELLLKLGRLSKIDDIPNKTEEISQLMAVAKKEVDDYLNRSDDIENELA